MMDAMLDANGVAITVGATVKLVGVVTSLNPFDNRFRDVQITLSHPLPSSSGPAVNIVHPVGAEVTPPGYITVISVPPGVLVVGA